MNLDQRVGALRERMSQIVRQAAQAEEEWKKGNPFCGGSCGIVGEASGY